MLSTTSSTLTSKGQLTLPKDIRDDLKLKAGDKVFFEQLDDGAYTIRTKKIDIRELMGLANYTGPAKSLEDIEQGIAQAMEESWR